MATVLEGVELGLVPFGAVAQKTSNLPLESESAKMFDSVSTYRTNKMHITFKTSQNYHPDHIMHVLTW